jgi:glycosyltransferase involved in cell wall biosynthesis
LNESKKILIITSEFPPGPGGIGNHAYNLAKYLRKNKTGVRVLAVSDFVNKKEEEEFDAGLNYDIFRFPRFKSRVWTYLRRIKAIWYTLRNKNFTHVIFSGRFSLLASLVIRKKNKLKFIAIAHGGDINAENSLIKFTVNRALMKMDLIIPVSNFSKSKITADASPDKIIVIPNGFDFEELGHLNINEKILPNGSVNLVTVGTVWPRKGHHNVINALPKIISEHPHTKYNIIGRHADLTQVKEFFEEPKLKQYMNIYGEVSNEEMFRILNQSQIFIMLSESQSSGDFEGFGIAVLEANYFGLPAIGSRNSGLEDSINNGVSGILVDPKNPAEVSDAVNKILQNYKKFSAGAREWAMKHHWSNIIKKYLEAIGEIK